MEVVVVVLQCLAGLALVAATVAAWTFGNRWRRGEPLTQPTDRAQAAEMAVNIVPFAVLIIVFGAERQTRLGFAGELGLILLGGAAFAAVMIPLAAWSRRLKRQGFEATTLPQPARAGDPLPPEAPVASVAGGLKEAAPALSALAVVIGLTAASTAALSSGQRWALWAVPIAAVGLPLLLLLARYPRDLVQVASIDIAAPPERVWELMASKETPAHWHPHILKVERTLGPDGRVRLLSHMRTLADCPTCSYPRPEHVDHVASADVLEQVDGSHEIVRMAPAVEDGPWFLRSMFRSLTAERRIETIPGGTRVHARSVMTGARLFMVLGARSANAAAQSLEELKAFAENSTAAPTLQQARRRLFEVQHAPKVCGCGKA